MEPDKGNSQLHFTAYFSAFRSVFCFLAELSSVTLLNSFTRFLFCFQKTLISQELCENWCKKLIHLKRPWCWERLKAGREGDDRGWDGWVASPTQRMWVWVNSGNWGWTGRPGVLQCMGSQRVGYDWVAELNCVKTNCQTMEREN